MALVAFLYRFCRIFIGGFSCFFFIAFAESLSVALVAFSFIAFAESLSVALVAFSFIAFAGSDALSLFLATFSFTVLFALSPLPLLNQK
ncbi:hypothetical protein AB6F55_10625 [Providencia hangzhouensis]